MKGDVDGRNRTTFTLRDSRAVEAGVSVLPAAPKENTGRLILIRNAQPIGQAYY